MPVWGVLGMWGGSPGLQPCGGGCPGVHVHWECDPSQWGKASEAEGTGMGECLLPTLGQIGLAGM